MTRMLTFPLLFGVFFSSWSPAPADEPAQVTQSAAVPNAAGVYWIAFAAMPGLEDAERRAVEDASASVREPLSQDIAAILPRYQTALHELQRARRIVPCDWQLDDSAGPQLIMSHLQKARDLSRVGVLRARQRFASGDTEGALADLLAIFKLARDCAASTYVISLLVDASIEERAAETLTLHLPALTAAQLDAVTAELSRLRLPPSAGQLIAAEGAMFGRWLENAVNREAEKRQGNEAGGEILNAVLNELSIELQAPPTEADRARRAELLKSVTLADVRKAVQQLNADHQELARISALPAPERVAPLAELASALDAARQLTAPADIQRCFSALLLPQELNLVRRIELIHIRRELLLQALRVQRQGPDSVEPIAGHGVEYRKTENGFELTCSCGEIVKIAVGQ